MPPQVDKRSPGFISTCKECKQNIQWFLHFPPCAMGTSFSQLAQIKDSLIRVNLLELDIKNTT